MQVTVDIFGHLKVESDCTKLVKQNQISINKCDITTFLFKENILKSTSVLGNFPHLYKC